MQSHTQSPEALWPVDIVARRDFGVLQFFHCRISSGYTMQSRYTGQPIKRKKSFSISSVSPGDQLLAIEPEE